MCNVENIAKGGNYHSHTSRFVALESWVTSFVTSFIKIINVKSFNRLHDVKLFPVVQCARCSSRKCITIMDFRRYVSSLTISRWLELTESVWCNRNAVLDRYEANTCKSWCCKLLMTRNNTERMKVTTARKSCSTYGASCCRSRMYVAIEAIVGPAVWSGACHVCHIMTSPLSLWSVIPHHIDGMGCSRTELLVGHFRPSQILARNITGSVSSLCTELCIDHQRRLCALAWVGWYRKCDA